MRHLGSVTTWETFLANSHALSNDLHIARKLREVPKHVGVLVRHKASQVCLNFSRAEFSIRHSDHNTVTIDDGLLSPSFLFARDLASHWCIGVEYPSR